VNRAVNHMNKNELALALHDIGAVKFGEFTLKTGIKSPIYIDLRLLVSHPKLLKAVARMYAARLKRLEFDRIAGVPYGALSIATIASVLLNKPLVYARKEVKEHGTMRQIEGEFRAGEKTVVVEDLVTSGSSVLESTEVFRAAGLTVTDAVVLLDREQGGVENLREKGVRVHSVMKITQLLEVLKENGKITGQQFSDAMAFIKSTQIKA